MSDCLFCRIVRGEIPSKKVYEDEYVFAFHDIHPVAPVHVLVVPKVHVDSMAHLGGEHEVAMGRLMVAAGKIAREQGWPAGGVSSAPSHSGRVRSPAAHVEALRRAVWVLSASGTG